MSAMLYAPALARELPLVLDVWPATGELMGWSRYTTYAAVKAGHIPSLKVGGRVLVPTATLLDMLGIGYEVTPRAGAGQAAASLSTELAS